jgi:Contractile injection system tube protein
MTTFPGAPRLLKGAIVAIALPNPVPQVIPFQYNPVTLTRTLEVKAAGEEGSTSEALRLEGAPTESIKLDLEFDATDKLESADPTAVSQGIYPQLSALETLIYPPSSTVIANQLLMAFGTIEIAPAVAPLTLFVWGTKRILPVRLTEFSITEEAYDTNLNPIRAKVSLGLRVLSYNDLNVTNPGYHLFLAHQIIKETSANLGRINNLDAVIGGNLNVL